MADRYIVFFGLISHISETDDYAHKTRAALVNGDQHPHFPYVIVGTGPGETHLVQSQSLTILIGGVPVAVPAQATDRGFLDQVPHLSFVGDGQLLPAVGGGTSAEATTYFRYPGGRLATHTLYDRQAEFRQGKRKVVQAVAKTVVLVFDDGGQPVHVRDGGNDIPVTGSCVLIANATPASPPHNHFTKHGDLTDGSVGKPTDGGTHSEVPTQPIPCGWINEAIARLTESSRAHLERTAARERDHHDHGSSSQRDHPVATSLEEFLELFPTSIDIECSQSQWP